MINWLAIKSHILADKAVGSTLRTSHQRSIPIAHRKTLFFMFWSEKRPVFRLFSDYRFLIFLVEKDEHMGIFRIWLAIRSHCFSGPEIESL